MCTSAGPADLCGFVYGRRYVGTIMLYASYDYKLVVLSIALAMFLAYAALDSAARAVAMRTLWGIPRWWRKLRGTPDRAELSFSLLTDAVPAILWTARADGSVDFIRDKLYRYPGFRKEQGIDAGWTAAIHPDDLAICQSKWEHCIQLGEPLEVEYRICGADGNNRWFLVKGNPVHNPQGKIV